MNFVIYKPSKGHSGGRWHGAHFIKEIRQYGLRLPNIYPLCGGKYSPLYADIKGDNRIRNKKIIVIIPHEVTFKSFLVDIILFTLVRVCVFFGWKVLYLDFEDCFWKYGKASSTVRFLWMNRGLKTARHVVSSTKFGMRKCIERGLSKDVKYHVIAPPFNSYRLDLDMSFQSRKFDVVMFFRPDIWNKGFDWILLNWRVFSNNRVLLVARRSIFLEFKELIDKLNSDYNCSTEWKLDVTDDEKRQLLLNSKILLFPSYFEGYGLPPLEANQLGCYVVCRDIPVLRETAPFSIFSDFDDVEELIALIKNLSNKDKNEKYQRIESHYSLQVKELMEQVLL